MTRTAGLTRACGHCGETFHPHSASPGLFCSRVCASRHRQPSWEERYWSKVDRHTTAGGCWLWVGRRDSAGYGTIRWRQPDGRPTLKRATHLAWKVTYGEWPARGTSLCHRCDNPPCVRVDHLFRGTNRTNTADRTEKGRGAAGRRNGSARLSDDDVRAIRARYAAGDVTQTTLAAEFGVSQSLVSLIVLDKNWRHVASLGDGVHAWHGDVHRANRDVRLA